MTTYLITTIKRFIGESFDTKPTTGIPPGSTFFEVDTKNEVIYTGSAWAYLVNNPVFAIRAEQSIKITEEEEELATLYISVLQRMGSVEGRGAVVSLPISTAVNALKFVEAVGLRKDTYLGITDRGAIVDAATISLLQNVSVSDRMHIVESGVVLVTL